MVTLCDKNGQVLGYLQSDSLDRMGLHNMMHVEERTVASAGLGGLATGAWRTRLFNTICTNSITGASLASNQITLPAGTYHAQGRAPQYCSTANILRLEKISPTAADLLYGGVKYEANMTDDAIIIGNFSLSETSVIELQHRVSVYNTTGYGGFADIGQPYNIFAQLMIWKLS